MIGAFNGTAYAYRRYGRRHSSRRLLPAEGLLGVDAVALNQDALSLTNRQASGNSGKSETPSPGEMTAMEGGRTS
jgi:hypothetical protein